MKIKIGDVEHDVPDAVGAALDAAGKRLAALETEAKTRAEEAGRLKAEAEAKGRADADLKLRHDVEAAAKKGEFDKALSLANERVTRLGERYRDSALRALLAAHPKLRRSGLDPVTREALISDALTSLAQGARFDIEADKLLIERDGKAVEPQAHVDAFLSARPWMQETATGSGMVPGSGVPASTETVTRSQIDHLTEDQQAKLLAGKLKVID